MPKINRNNLQDALNVVNQLIPDEFSKYSLLSFLSDAIIYANNINSWNWSLNLDISGKFIRFNVGQEYCVDIRKNYILILALKKYVKAELFLKQFPIEFQGQYKKIIVKTQNVDDAPDELIKIPDSVGCIFKNENLVNGLQFLKNANQRFIDEAIAHTRIKPKMVNAHSTGLISLLFQYCEKQVPNPAYISTKEESLNFYQNDYKQRVGGGFGNSMLNRKIERTSISLICNDYRARGWQVSSVEAKKCGFDLFCTKDGKQECVEVKGIQGDLLSFIITAGEVKQAWQNKNFILYIVTSALSNPVINKFSANEFTENFKIEPISYRALLKNNRKKK